MSKKSTIFKTAVRLFATQGYEATTTLQIAKEVGVTEPAVFYHFRSKNSFFSTVLESAAIGIPDEKWGERPLMIITLKPEYQGKVTPEKLREFMKQFAAKGQIPKYAIPEQYVFMDSIPKTSVGKLDKKVLRKEFGHR